VPSQARPWLPATAKHPFITTRPKVDGTDFYMFNSYEAGRHRLRHADRNYQPFENPQGGPNYYTMDPNALYEILIDNNGDGGGSDLSVPLHDRRQWPHGDGGHQIDSGAAGQHRRASPPPISSAQNVAETYTLTLVKGDRRTGTVQRSPMPPRAARRVSPSRSTTSARSRLQIMRPMPRSFIHSITIPGCSTPGRVFVGQRQDGFVVNLGETFDLVNIKYPVEELAPRAAMPAARAEFARRLQRHLARAGSTGACLTAGNDPVIGGWTTASVRQASVLNPQPQSSKSVASVGPVTSPTGASVQGGAWSQVSRLGMPLVNELVIGLPDKDRFNASRPQDDAQFADYVTNPSLPVLLQVLFGAAGVKAPNVYPRTDLEAAFLTGIAGLNQPEGTPAEELRLNTSTRSRHSACAE
jgi:hypothetical protein